MAAVGCDLCPTMNPPFTIEQFLGVFAAYNAAIWPAQIVAYVLGLVAVAAVWSARPIASCLKLAILALMWALNGIGYQFLFFSTINPAAHVFAGFFILEAILIAACAVAAKELRFEIGRDFRSFTGLAAILYAMNIYPILGIQAGHGLLAGPMFGVAPCPTTIFTIGMLLLMRGRWVVWLSIIPLLWSLVGLAAALQLGIPEDLALPVAGLCLLLALAADTFRLWSGRRSAATSFGSAHP
jgi:Family of unknown function (DUF6064)